MAGNDLQSLRNLLAEPFATDGFRDVVLPVVVIAAGTASLAPVLARPLAAPSDRQASTSMLWAVLLGLALVAGVLALSHVVASQAGALPATFVGADPLFLTTSIFAELPSVLAGLV